MCSCKFPPDESGNPAHIGIQKQTKTRPGCLLAVGAFLVGENPSDSGEAKGEKASRKTPLRNGKWQGKSGDSSASGRGAKL